MRSNSAGGGCLEFIGQWNPFICVSSNQKSSTTIHDILSHLSLRRWGWIPATLAGIPEKTWTCTLHDWDDFPFDKSLLHSTFNINSTSIQHQLNIAFNSSTLILRHYSSRKGNYKNTKCLENVCKMKTVLVVDLIWLYLTWPRPAHDLTI